MNHLTEEQLTLAYYGDLEPELSQHIQDCSACGLDFDRLKDLLDSIREYPVPERAGSYGSDVWVRLVPQLPVAKARRSRFQWTWGRWWMAGPALATLLLVAFFAGMLFQHRREPAPISADASQRVLRMVIGDHLDRSQVLLAELVNASPGSIDLRDERDRARDLLSENRLLRQTAARTGDPSHAALLDELERVLLDIANTGSNTSPADLEALQRRIGSEGLLFRVRIVDANIREKGQKI
ncbi:MAG: hypothetical protein ACJ74Z_03120 [Bryobacteraceae bacterium]